VFDPWGFVDPATSSRLADLADYLVKLGTGFVAAWGIVVKIGKPAYAFRAKILERRDDALAAKIRSILDPELQDLGRLSSCTDQLETVLTRQREVFTDLDSVLHIVNDNRDRIDETNDLLNVLGFSSDRRASNDERRAEFDQLLTKLRAHQKVRARAEAETRLVIDGPSDAL
jgi:hypothetical protein